ncbi:zinc finger protein 14-like [Penaeus monodon]|uniref:zinc finger protein 14-like n=1 Tax=Penaeus monodon TaxID=6687 RepID=UPI0018A750D9|nr:zinc finger protein 14-like [Penaeus monodon]
MSKVPFRAKDCGKTCSSDGVFNDVRGKTEGGYTTKIVIQKGNVLHVRNHKPVTLAVRGHFREKLCCKAQKVHTKEKPYNCEICNKAFTWKRSRKHVLESHMTVHTIEKPYSCEICKKGFSYKCSQKIHMRMLEGDIQLLFIHMHCCHRLGMIREMAPDCPQCSKKMLLPLINKVTDVEVVGRFIHECYHFLQDFRSRLQEEISYIIKEQQKDIQLSYDWKLMKKTISFGSPYGGGAQPLRSSGSSGERRLGPSVGDQPHLGPHLSPQSRRQEYDAEHGNGSSMVPVLFPNTAHGI